MRVRLWVVPSPHGLADRIRRARQDADLTQSALAKLVGVDIRTVQGWESGRTPRGAAAAKLERALSIDLAAAPESASPRLDEATDAQLVAHLAGRLADRDRMLRDRDELIAELQQQSGGSEVVELPRAAGRWAARTRERD